MHSEPNTDGICNTFSAVPWNMPRKLEASSSSKSAGSSFFVAFHARLNPRERTHMGSKEEEEEETGAAVDTPNSPPPPFLWRGRGIFRGSHLMMKRDASFLLLLLPFPIWRSARSD